MDFSALNDLVKGLKALEPEHYSQGLRLRPNYLLYTLEGELSSPQKEFLNSKEIPWAEYKNCSALEALLAFLKSVNGGIYIPTLSPDIFQSQAQQCVFLLDPHLIDEFEDVLTKKRRGVLIRRHLLASHNFKEAIYL